MKRSMWLGLVVVVLAAVGGSGCLTFWGMNREAPKEEAQLAGRLSLHAYYASEVRESGVQTAYHLSGKPVHFQERPLLTSDFIESIEVYPVEGGMALNVYLDAEGTNLWSEATSRYYGRHLAMLVDGGFRALVVIPNASDSGAFQLTGPFTPEEARQIADFVNKRKAKK